jgi:lipid-A-disaccharide synthase-like uncharacterized protein
MRVERFAAPRWLAFALFAALPSIARAQDYRDAGYGVIDNRPRRAELLDGRARDSEQRIRAAAQGLDLQHRLSEIRIADGSSGPIVGIETEHGAVELTPREFVSAVQSAQEAQKRRGFLYVLFNITQPWGFVWVSVGFLAQALFTYRMILQWWASEKHKRSVVPVGYWWGSMFGGALLFAYFVWRKDIVGYIGQSTGIFIYARNLVLIYRGRRIESEGARPLAPDEPAPEIAS